MPLPSGGIVGRFDAAVGITASGGRISAIAEQSGSGNDRSQLTAAKQPFAAVDWLGRPVIRHEAPAGGEHKTTFADATAIDIRNHTLAIVKRDHRISVATHVGIGASLSTSLVRDAGTLGSPGPTLAGRQTTLRDRVNPHLVVYSSATTALGAIKAFGNYEPQQSLAQASVAGTGSGAAIGGAYAAGTSGMCADEYASILYGRVLSPSEMADLIAFYNAAFDLRTTPYAKQLFMGGDSITAGNGTVPEGGNNWPMQVMREATKEWRITNGGVSGSTVATVTARAASEDAYIEPGWFNVYHQALGRNDMGTTGGFLTAAQHYANTKTLCSQKLGVGWNKILVATLIAGTGSAATDDAFNALLRGAAHGGTGAGIEAEVPGTQVVDYQALAQFNNGTTSAANTTWYLDGTHPTTAGAGKMADLTASTLVALDNPPVYVTTNPHLALIV